MSTIENPLEMHHETMHHTYHSKEGEKTGDGANDESSVHEGVTLRISVSVNHDLLDRVIQGILHRTTVPFVNLIMDQNNHALRQYWATRSTIRSFSFSLQSS